MNIKMPGEKTRAACETCQKFTEATWSYGPFQTNDGIKAKDVMQAYCDICGESLLLAQQSVYKIREKRLENQRRTSVNLTAPLKDLAFSYVSQIGADPAKGPELIIKAFLLVCQENPETALDAIRSIELKFLKGKKDQKVDVTFPSETMKQLDELSRKAGYKRSEFMRRAIWATQRLPGIGQDLKRLVATQRTGILPS